MALVGGANLILAPEVTVAFSKERMLAPDGKCKPFDAGANGYVRGEGCGIVIIKRLAQAMRDGDTIHAVLRGTAVNQDGKTAGITAPNGPSQQQCIRKALGQAGLTPDDLTYVEAHGTGTPLGDPIELQALQAVFAGRRDDAEPIHVGSVKANIGHLETASGIASLIKVVLMMRHGEIPPQHHFQSINPNIPHGAAPLHIARERTPWAGRRIAGVSGFGFGGTNAHALLEAFTASRDGLFPQNPSEDRPLHLLPLSAQTDVALKALAARYVDHLEKHDDTPFADVCFSAAAGRTALPVRLTLTADSAAQARQRLQAFVASEKTAGISTGTLSSRERPKAAFLFTGQGSQ